MRFTLRREMEIPHGRNQNITDDTDSKVLTRTAAARQLGMSERQQVTAIRVANVPAEEFERQVEGKNPPTITAREATRRRAVPLPGGCPSYPGRTWLLPGTL